MEDVIQLGGSVELSGFRDLEKINNAVINKIVGNYTSRYSDLSSNFEKLHLQLKKVHKTEKNYLIELHARAISNGAVLTSKVEDRNLYFALDKALKKIEAEMSRKR